MIMRHPVNLDCENCEAKISYGVVVNNKILCDDCHAAYNPIRVKISIGGLKQC